MKSKRKNFLAQPVCLQSRIVIISLFLGILVGCSTTPVPLSQTELDAIASTRFESLTAGQNAIDKPITLYEAMARAIKHNLDHQVELATKALKSKELDLSRLEMLPRAVVTAGYAGRDKYSGARSSRILGPKRIGDESLVSSTSSELETFYGDLTFSWNILDFGLSYVRSKQRADEYMIAEEQKRRIVNRIVEDVRTAYWRAVSADRLIDKLSTLDVDIENALSQSRESYTRRKSAPLDALAYQRDMLEIKEKLFNLHRDLGVAKKQLAALMNVDPSIEYSLQRPNRREVQLNFDLDGEEMVEIAMRNRPELREISYRQRINEREGVAALLERLPGLKLTGGMNYESNDFLFNNSWLGWGALASWDVINAFKYPAHRASIEAQSVLLDKQALAMSMAVITQVHVSRTRFELAKKHLDTMRQSHTVQNGILEQMDARYQSRKASRHSIIRERMNALVADAKYDIALADLQNSFANLYASIGVDPFGPALTDGDSIDSMAEKLHQHWVSLGDRIAL